MGKKSLENKKTAPRNKSRPTLKRTDAVIHGYGMAGPPFKFADTNAFLNKILKPHNSVDVRKARNATKRVRRN